MRFQLIDTVLDVSDTRASAMKQVSAAEEYLQDHFPGFPVLPGVLMLEAMVQTARHLLHNRPCAADAAPTRRVLGRVKALKYGAMVRPGDRLRLEVELLKEQDGEALFKGRGVVVDPSGDETGVAVSGRFTMRPVRI